ncbi:hypothetical protein BDV32DRAFT_146474 [Aspergillus pseudonomiae]|uniref:Uncharacterized protein n=1 Tax=Aspergillus pseudonomiae TaxID=1506151 RepID=A0A5N6ICU0_9EURO|nr:uncharacterized protein BDV37DRAFT_279010 [Aspergillus pseudonomiae]KAB8263659.1 hypothetical protein BDV32DRAFT_146474 [Aspergillus pseudonomiae]KAE8408524.1 hypothetical protein BDV37DRAFT_279010 [Aspergillus pseudonomiae]
MASPRQLESIPDGWTTDPADIQFELIWKGPESEGQVMAMRLGLSQPEVIMTTERVTGNSLCMFQSSERFYMWNQVDDTVWQITKPTDLLDIFRTITNKGEAALELEEIESVRVDKDEEHDE